jgi:hypothetical protein
MAEMEIAERPGIRPCLKFMLKITKPKLLTTNNNESVNGMKQSHIVLLEESAQKDYMAFDSKFHSDRDPTTSISMEGPVADGKFHPKQYIDDANRLLGQSNGKHYQRIPGKDQEHDGQVMVRLRKKRFVVLDYSFAPSEDELNAATNFPHVRIVDKAGRGICIHVGVSVSPTFHLLDRRQPHRLQNSAEKLAFLFVSMIQILPNKNRYTCGLAFASAANAT